MHEHHDRHVSTLESPIEYLKFATVITAIVVLSVALTSVRGFGLENFMTQFMGVFFIVFAGFKLVQLEMFVLAYRGYDVIAKRWAAWGYAFPFIELGLGVGYLLLGNLAVLNVLTILITATAGIGVLRELRRKSVMKCACLGTVIRLPLSKVSFVEDFAMLIMAGVMLVL